MISCWGNIRSNTYDLRGIKKFLENNESPTLGDCFTGILILEKYPGNDSVENVLVFKQQNKGLRADNMHFDGSAITTQVFQSKNFFSTNASSNVCLLAPLDATKCGANGTWQGKYLIDVHWDSSAPEFYAYLLPVSKFNAEKQDTHTNAFVAALYS